MLTRIRRPDGSKEENEYDIMGRLVKSENKAKDGFVIKLEEYKYDLQGNIVEQYSERMQNVCMLI
jgi:hypothetical protein